MVAPDVFTEELRPQDSNRPRALAPITGSLDTTCGRAGAAVDRPVFSTTTMPPLPRLWHIPTGFPKGNALGWAPALSL